MPKTATTFTKRPARLPAIDLNTDPLRRQKSSKGRQALFVGNINPTTSYTTLREAFKIFPSFAGFRLSKSSRTGCSGCDLIIHCPVARHPTNPVGFVQFHNMEAAIIAQQRLKATPLSLEGRQLKISYAKPRQSHPLDVLPTPDGSSTPHAATQNQSEFAPSATVCIRYEDGRWDKPFHLIKHILSSMDGFQEIRSREYHDLS